MHRIDADAFVTHEAGEIRVPGAVNFTFGGLEGNVLFITADTPIYAACLQAVGR